MPGSPQEIDESRENYVVRTLLLTDVVDGAKLIETYGDVRTAQAQKRHDRLARDLVREFSGIEIDKTDGFFFLFERPLDAVRYALAYHQALSEFSEEVRVAVRARVGIHLGEVVLRRNTPEDVALGANPLEVEGFAKHLASRVMSLAKGNQTLLTKPAFTLARRAIVGSGDISKAAVWLEHGRYAIEGIDEPVEICEVGVADFSVLAPPEDSSQAKRDLDSREDSTLGWRPTVGVSIPGRASWKLDRKLGESAQGETWLVHQQGTGSLHTFKFIFDSEHLRSIKKEIALLRLIRENLGERSDIARIYDVQLEQSPYYLETDYSVDGTLQDWAEAKGDLNNTPLPTRLEIASQLAGALQAAHSIGIVHKMVKPSNILVEQRRDRSVRIRLTDFGQGKIVDPGLLESLEDPDLTFSTLSRTQAAGRGDEGAPGGLLYVAPEIFAGGEHTPRSDIYSFGVLLFQLAVGDLNRPLGPGWEDSVDDPLLIEQIQVATRPNPSERTQSVEEIQLSLRKLEEKWVKEEEDPKRDGPLIRPPRAKDGTEAAEESLAAEPEPSEKDEERVGDYTILQKIGEGGFGSVYLAENLITPGRRYAIKIFTPTRGGGDFGSSLSDELQHVLDLVHPNVVQIRGFGNARRRGFEEPYLVMDYVEGPNGGSYNLKNHVTASGGKLEEKEVRRLFRQILSALCMVHEKMIAHLDIKPQNILLDRDYNAYISDFGISEAVHTATVAQRTVVAVKGVTPTYAAFEQIAFGQGSRRSDVYSLGVLLLECLTGRRCESIPSAVNPKVEYAPPSAFGLSAEWDEILEKCLVHDPGDRYETACEMGRAVESLVLTDPVDGIAAIAAPLADTSKEQDRFEVKKKSRVGGLAAWIRASTLGKVVTGGCVAALGAAALFWGSVNGPDRNTGADKEEAFRFVSSTRSPTPTRVDGGIPGSEPTAAVVVMATDTLPVEPTPTFTTIPPTETRTASPAPSDTPAPTNPPTVKPIPTIPPTIPPTITPTHTTPPTDTPTPTTPPTDTPTPTTPPTDTPTPTTPPTDTPTPTPMPKMEKPTATPKKTNTPSPTPTKTPPPSPTPTEAMEESGIAKVSADRLAKDVFDAVGRKDKKTFDELVIAEGGKKAWPRLIGLTIVGYGVKIDGPETLDVDVRLRASRGGTRLENTQELKWTVQRDEGIWRVSVWEIR